MEHFNGIKRNKCFPSFRKWALFIVMQNSFVGIYLFRQLQSKRDDTFNNCEHDWIKILKNLNLQYCDSQLEAIILILVILFLYCTIHSVFQ